MMETAARPHQLTQSGDMPGLLPRPLHSEVRVPWQRSTTFLHRLLPSFRGEEEHELHINNDNIPAIWRVEELSRCAAAVVNSIIGTGMVFNLIKAVS